MGYEHALEHPFYWPAVHPVTAPMLPGEAWKSWQAGTITREEFSDIIDHWSI